MDMFSAGSEAHRLFSSGHVGVVIKKLDIRRYNQAPNFFGKPLGGHGNNSSGMIDYTLNGDLQQRKHPMLRQQPHQLSPSEFGLTPFFDKKTFTDVMHFADSGPTFTSNRTRNQAVQETGFDPVCFLNFPVWNERTQTQHLMSSHRTPQEGGECGGNIGSVFPQDEDINSMRLRVIREGEKEDRENNNVTEKEVKSKRKRARTSKTNEEMESQRMTRIMVERKRRKQMNEHLCVLRSLMPGSYVKRGDQASIIGGVIEFLRELEQLQQCLESQKRNLEEIGHGKTGDMIEPTNPSFSPVMRVVNQTQPVVITKTVTEIEGGGRLLEEITENKSCLADVEVKLLGFDGMIKILSRRRPGQLLMTMAALEDLHLSILHTSITTMEQTVLYSFIVKASSTFYL
ncbi:Myc-type [Hirschfeldia incana]|nr:Myc-type [Hirschfeldia incana]